MEDKKVSIVIPTHNRAHFLTRCIQSCVDQTVDCEIIVCDHGSSDNTMEVVMAFGTRVKYIKREFDHGVHFCWLEGIINASNDLVHLQFDDDWLERDFIERCLELFDEDVGMVFTNFKLYTDSTGEISSDLKFFDAKVESGQYSSKFALSRLAYRLISPGCMILRKKILLKYLFVGEVPFSEFHYKGVGPDLLFSLMSLLEYRNVGYIKEHLAVFRAHEQSITIDAAQSSDKMKNFQEAYSSSVNFFAVSYLISKCKMMRLIRKIVTFIVIILNRKIYTR